MAADQRFSGVGINTFPLSSAFTTLQQTVGTTITQLTAIATSVKTSPIVKADPANTGLVYVVVSGGTTATGFALAAGEAVPVPVDDLSKIYLIASAAAQKVSAIAGV